MQRLFWLLAQFRAKFIFPQACLLCGEVLIDPRLVPLCSPCEQRQKPLMGPLCVYCGDLVAGPRHRRYGICVGCRETPLSFSEAWAYGPYRGELRELIRSFKYSGHQRLAIPFSRWMATALRSHSSIVPDFLVPVPSHRRRVFQRGFDPTLVLARELAREIAVEIYPGMTRRRHTAPLYGLRKAERRKVLKGAFDVPRRNPLRRASVLLVDDILTTGSTADELSRVLLEEAAVASVTLVVVARAIRRGVQF